MSNHETPTSANGRRDPGFRVALVINESILRQIETRTAIRETELFGLTLSCESSLMARDVLTGSDTPDVALILLDLSLAETCLPIMSKEQLARTVLTHEPEIDPDHDMIAVPHPVSKAVVLDILDRLGR